MKTILRPFATFILGMALFVTCMSGIAPSVAAPAVPQVCAETGQCADETI